MAGLGLIEGLCWRYSEAKASPRARFRSHDWCCFALVCVSVTTATVKDSAWPPQVQCECCRGCARRAGDNDPWRGEAGKLLMGCAVSMRSDFQARKQRRKLANAAQSRIAHRIALEDMT